MQTNSDFKELLRLFNAEQVRYLVVGGYAVMHYTEPRYTKDLDVWVDPTRENAERVFRALQLFGAPVSEVTVSDFTDPELVYQIGVAPVRVDILMCIPAISFESAWNNHVEIDFGGEPAHMISRTDLIASKKSTGRLQDQLDLQNLE